MNQKTQNLKQQNQPFLSHFPSALLLKNNAMSPLIDNISPLRAACKDLIDNDQMIFKTRFIQSPSNQNINLNKDINRKIPNETGKIKNQKAYRENPKKGQNKSFCNPQINNIIEQNDPQSTHGNTVIFDKKLSQIVTKNVQKQNTYFKQRYQNLSKSKSPAQKSKEPSVNKKNENKSTSNPKQQKQNKSSLSQQIITQAKSNNQTPNKKLNKQNEKYSQIHNQQMNAQINQIKNDPVQLRTPSDSSKNLKLKYNNSSPINDSQIKTAQSPQSPQYFDIKENRNKYNSERMTAVHCQNHNKKAKYVTEKGVFLCSKCAIAFAQFINLTDIETYLRNQHEKNNCFNFSKLLEQSNSPQQTESNLENQEQIIILKNQHDTMKSQLNQLNDQKKYLNISYSQIQQYIEQRFLNFEAEMIKQKNKVLQEIQIMLNQKNNKLDQLQQNINLFIESIQHSIQSINIQINQQYKMASISTQINLEYNLLQQQINKLAQTNIPQLSFVYDEQICNNMINTSFFQLKQGSELVQNKEQKLLFTQDHPQITKEEKFQFLLENKDQEQLIHSELVQQQQPKQQDLTPFTIEKDDQKVIAIEKQTSIFNETLFNQQNYLNIMPDDSMNQNPLKESNEINQLSESLNQFTSFSNKLLKQQKPKKYLEENIKEELKESEKNIKDWELNRQSCSNDLECYNSEMYTSQQKTTKFDQLFSSPQFLKN